MAEMKSIQISAELAQGAIFRFAGVESAIRCIALPLRDGDLVSQQAAEALVLVADAVSRLTVDLDAGSWADAPAVRAARTARKAKESTEAAHG